MGRRFALKNGEDVFFIEDTFSKIAKKNSINRKPEGTYGGPDSAEKSGLTFDPNSGENMLKTVCGSKVKTVLGQKVKTGFVKSVENLASKNWRRFLDKKWRQRICVYILSKSAFLVSEDDFWVTI